MGFNFGTVNKPVNNQSYLRPWNIYNDVKFEGISEPVSGDTKDGGTWKAWDITFSSPEGIYRERIFDPNKQAGERRELEGTDGKKRVLPSEVERIQEIFRQIISVYAQDNMKAKLQEYVEQGKLANIEFSDFIKVMNAILKNPKEPSEEYPIQIKLQGRKDSEGRTYARLPNAAISRDGEVFMERFLGKNLTMSAYEQTEAKKYNSAKPTNMDEVDKTPTSNDGGASVDELLKGL